MWYIGVLAAAISSLVPARAQISVPPNIHFFGDEIVRKLSSDGPTDPPTPVGDGEKPEGWQHVILFQNGEQLRGQLISIENNEIGWSRPDAAGPIRIPTSDVKLIELNSFGDPNEPGSAPQVFSSKGQIPSWATVQLASGDWLYGNVKSNDGEEFALKTSSNVEAVFSRSKVDWMHFGIQPAPSIHYSKVDSLFDFRKLPSLIGPSIDKQVRDGVVILSEGEWTAPLGPTFSRLEVNLEIQDDPEGFTTVLFPSGMEGKKDVTATVVVQFNPNVLLYRGPFEDRGMTSIPVADDGREPGLPSVYRILYDAPSGRLAVIRNGKVLVDRRNPQPPPAPGNSAILRIPFVTLRGTLQGVPRPIALRSLYIQPWDGAISNEAEEAVKCDYLSLENGPPLSGKIEAVSPGKDAMSGNGELKFAGATMAVKAGMLLKLREQPAALDHPQCRIILKTNGEFYASDLSLRENIVTCKTAFTDHLRAPLAAMAHIQFPQVIAPANSDKAKGESSVLVFKNGDEMAGSLLAATNAGTSLRWRSASGQEIEFTPHSVAGIRFSAPENNAKGPAATLELTNGDRFRGEFLGFNNDMIRFRHSLLGEISIERKAIRILLPAEQIEDGARAPHAIPIWVAGDHDRETENGGEHAFDRWIYLDGAYVLKMSDALPVYALKPTGLLVSKGDDPLPDRYQFSIDVTDSGGNAPEFTACLGDELRGPGLSLALEGETLAVDLTAPHNGSGSRNWEVVLRDKLSERRSRVELRAYVDPGQGTVDIYLDGIPITRAGHKPVERLLNILRRVRVEPADPDNPVIFSNMRIAPWNGELPKPGAPEPAVALKNGDVAPGSIRSWADGKCNIESNLGAIVVPADTVQEVDFANPPAPQRCAARLRLVDGSILHAAQYQWNSSTISGHSKNLGEFRLSTDAVSELIVDPAPLDLHPSVDRTKSSGVEKPDKAE